jgi:hypothetical protein
MDIRSTFLFVIKDSKNNSYPFVTRNATITFLYIMLQVMRNSNFFISLSVDYFKLLKICECIRDYRPSRKQINLLIFNTKICNIKFFNVCKKFGPYLFYTIQGIDLLIHLKQ